MDGPPPGWTRTPPLVVGGTQGALEEDGGPVVTTFTGGEFCEYFVERQCISGRHVSGI